jgi:hypothetical protein
VKNTNTLPVSERLNPGRVAGLTPGWRLGWRQVGVAGLDPCWAGAWWVGT